MKKRILGFLFLSMFWIPQKSFGQRFLMDLVDTTNNMGKGMLSIYERYNRVRISGYMQPQFQYISKKGSETFAGGNFSPQANNRFMLRRGRLRVDYAHLNEQGDPTSYFVFQFDGTERGVAIRDFWGRFYENKFKVFALTTGMFARPFGFEVNLSSATREAPERGRMSQILMKTERDIGAMLTINDRKKGSNWGSFKFDIGVFNGQGMAGPMDYDSHKDLIGRISIKPTKILGSGDIRISAGLSGYLGAITSQSPIIYRSIKGSEGFVMAGDSSSKNYLKNAPRNYAGGDVQLRIPNRKGATEFRAEYIFGKQSSTSTNSETPGTYPVINGVPEPLYVRNFDGAYFYFLQHLGSENHQFLLKYDWYDPNKKAFGKQVDSQKGYTKADIRYNTLSAGYVYYANESLKITFFYDHVLNEKTSIRGYASDVQDDVITCRVQYSF